MCSKLKKKIKEERHSTVDKPKKKTRKMKKKLNNDGGENDVFNFLPSVAIDFFFSFCKAK